MNTDHLQQWARDVGATAYRNRHYPDPTYTFSVDRLVAFAEMVRKAQCVDADQLPPLPETEYSLAFHDEGGAHDLLADGYTADQMRSYAAQAVAAERERCVKVCREADKSTHPSDLAEMIRKGIE